MEQGFEPLAVHGGDVAIPGLQGRSNVRDCDVGEVVRWQRKGGVPDDTFLASGELALESDSRFLLARECEFVLEGAQRADGDDAAVLGAEGERDRQGLE